MRLATPSHELRALDAMNNLGLWMTWATQGHELRTLVDMNVLGSCEQSPFEVMNCSSLWLTWMTPSRELRVLDAMNSSELWMKWMSWDLVYSGLLILWTTQGCAYCHPEANSAPSGYSINSWAPHSYAIRANRAITGPSFRRADYALWGADYKRGRGTSPKHSDLCSRAIIFTSSSCHYLIICIVSFMYFLYVFPYYSSTCNPMLLIFYILGLVVLLLLFYIVLSWSNTNLSIF